MGVSAGTASQIPADHHGFIQGFIGRNENILNIDTNLN